MAMESNTKETKIVRATPRKSEGQQEEQPRVTVKAAVKPQVRNHQKQVRQQPHSFVSPDLHGCQQQTAKGHSPSFHLSFGFSLDSRILACAKRFVTQIYH